MYRFNHPVHRNTLRQYHNSSRGDSWLPRFDSERGCCRMGRTAVCVVAHINAPTRRGISSCSSHIRTHFLPTNPSYVSQCNSCHLPKKKMSPLLYDPTWCKITAVFLTRRPTFVHDTFDNKNLMCKSYFFFFLEG